MTTAGSTKSGGHYPALNNCRCRSSINVATDRRKPMQQSEDLNGTQILAYETGPDRPREDA